MRKANPKPKAEQRIEIPANLAAFLTEVHQQILDGDEATLQETDDCLQCESAYGGLLQEGGSVFGFTYFPGEGTDYEWEIRLDKAEIEMVAQHTLTQFTLWACQGPECNNKFSDKDGLCFPHDYED